MMIYFIRIIVNYSYDKMRYNDSKINIFFIFRDSVLLKRCDRYKINASFLFMTYKRPTTDFKKRYHHEKNYFTYFHQ